LAVISMRFRAGLSMSARAASLATSISSTSSTTTVSFCSTRFPGRASWRPTAVAATRLIRFSTQVDF